MIVPNYDGTQIVDEQGYPSPGFQNILQTLLKNMTQSVGNEGYLIPSVTSQPGSASLPPPAPPTTLSQLDVLQASFQSASTPVSVDGQTVTVGALAGTIIFDPYELNGGAVGPPRVPKGQLKVLLNDGTFHAVVNL